MTGQVNSTVHAYTGVVMCKFFGHEIVIEETQFYQ